MLNDKYRLLKLFQKTQRIRGRKKLQKMVHLLRCAGIDLSFHYQYHHYGPYSAHLQGVMDELVEHNFITEIPEAGAYAYELTEEGDAFRRMLEEEGDFSFHYDDEMVAALMRESSQFLEVVSTYAFLLETGDTENEARQRTIMLKKHLEDKIEAAIMFYEQHIQ